MDTIFDERALTQEGRQFLIESCRQDCLSYGLRGITIGTAIYQLRTWKSELVGDENCAVVLMLRSYSLFAFHKRADGHQFHLQPANALWRAGYTGRPLE